MNRVIIFVAFFGIAAGMWNRPSIAWPLRATITDPRGRSIPFRAVSLGGDLIVDRSPDAMHPRPLAPRDTFAGITPASFPLDLRRGPVVFFTATSDSVQIAVGRNPFGTVHAVRALGRRLTVRLVKDSIVIEAQ